MNGRPLEELEQIRHLLASHGSHFSCDQIGEVLTLLHEMDLKIIVTNINSLVFNHEPAKFAFEQIFRKFDKEAHFVYLPSFRRVQVYITSPESALCARIEAEGWKVPDDILSSWTTETCPDTNDQGIVCYISQYNRATADDDNDQEQDDDVLKALLDCEEGQVPEKGPRNRLAPPLPQRLFLISPPASPPDNWQPKHESEPVINYDLLEALASLAPGETFVLHPPDDTKHHPGIVVTPCEHPASSHQQKVQIVPTRRPDRVVND